VYLGMEESVLAFGPKPEIFAYVIKKFFWLGNLKKSGGEGEMTPSDYGA
jgi:hypothetical protein